MKVFAIVNPASRVGKTASDVNELRDALERAGIEYNIELTEHPRHARTLASEAAKEYPVVLAVGGDGTVNEVAGGILESGSDSAMGVIPLGTGNDFARMIGLSGNLRDSVVKLRSSTATRVDVGRVAWADHSGRQESIFVNALGVGFDGHAARIAPRYKHLPFQLGYLTAILVALRTWTCPPVVISDTQMEAPKTFDDELFFVTVGNARDSGGGYTINPKASIVDGYLDVCLVSRVGFFRALRMLPSARTGKHLEQKEVVYWHSTGIEIQADVGLPIHTDGEVVSVLARDINVSIDMKALSVMVPSGMESKI